MVLHKKTSFHSSKEFSFLNFYRSSKAIFLLNSFHSSKEFSFLNFSRDRSQRLKIIPRFHSSKEFSFLNMNITVSEWADRYRICFHSSKEFSFLNLVLTDMQMKEEEGGFHSSKEFSFLNLRVHYPSSLRVDCGFPLLKGILIFKLERMRPQNNNNK